MKSKQNARRYSRLERFEYFVRHPIRKIKRQIEVLIEMYPRAKKYGFRYYISKKFRERMRSREQRQKYGSGFLSSKKRIKSLLLERDGSQCKRCTYRMRPEDLTIDHIKKRADGGSNLLNNLQLLCIPCHTRKDSPKWQKTITLSRVNYKKEIQDVYEANKRRIEKRNAKKYRSLEKRGAGILFRLRNKQGKNWILQKIREEDKVEADEFYRSEVEAPAPH